MKILTPSGYKEIADCQVGDDVAAFDMVTGAPLVNQIESIAWVDAVEWARWWTGQDVPPFKFYRINNRWTLNSEQSIWRNGTEVFHAKHLKVGDVIYDDADQPVTITSIEEIAQAGWWRFDISGDHSYIVDGLTLHNASRFWVGGSGTWDRTTTTHWATASNGAGGASAPGVNDTATFDASSGGGTVTVTWDTGTVTVQSITCGAFTGTLDFSASNNNVTLSQIPAFSGSGVGTRTINLGNGTWNLTNTGNGTIWTMATTTGLTFNANSSTINITAAAAGSSHTFVGGVGLTYSTVNLLAGAGEFVITTSTAFGVLTLNAGLVLNTSNNTLTCTTLNVAGSPGSPVAIFCVSAGFQTTFSVASGTVTLSWVALHGVVCSGGATFLAYNSFDLLRNSGITITPPTMTRSRAQSGFF